MTFTDTTATDTLSLTSLSVTLCDDEQSLAALRDDWNQLAGDIPFRCWQWVDCWWTHYRERTSRLMVAVVTDSDGDVLGIAPWYVHRSSRRGRVIRFLGAGEVCSDYLTILTRPGLEDAVAARLAEWLAGEISDQWDLVELNGVQQADSSIEHLANRLAELGHTVDRKPDASCWRTELGTDWNAFLATLSKSRRERTRSMLRKALDTGRATVHRVSNPQELTRAFEILIDLHQKRRNSLDQSGCFASPRFETFHRDVAGRLLADDRLRMQWIELEGRPVAAEYSFVGGDTVYYYQGGFEPEVADERPGWLSFAVSLRAAIDEQYQYYDFLRGDESYKASWKATARPLVQVRVAGQQKSARVRFATWRACREVKHWALNHWVLRLLARTKR